MRRLGYILLLVWGASGCRSRPSTLDMAFVNEASQQLSEAVQASFEQVEQSPSAGERRPRSPWDPAPTTYLPMTPEEAVRQALANSPVLRDLGGALLSSPETAQSILDAAIMETDPRFGPHAALSAFDAQMETSLYYSKNDRAFNNLLTGGGTNQLQQDLLTWEHQFRKLTGAGTRFALRKRIEYDANTAPQNLFPSAWTANVDLEARHPLLQGAGVTFNQLAGPDSRPGVINGVRIARVNTNVSLLEFEIGIRNLVSNVENAYWDLYFAYRKLDAKVAARERALTIWRTYSDRLETGSSGGDLTNEAQAREQLLRYEMDVQSALNGSLAGGTSNRNGATGGVFRAPGGVIPAERRLRLLMGLPINGDELIRPSIEPPTMRVVFTWDTVLSDALARRAELRRQRQVVNRRKMELMANRNFIKPRLDAFARYRVRGFGQDLIGDSNGAPFDDAINDLLTGDYQEWQFGVELTTDVGKRKAHAAVRNAELQLARERMVLEQQERNVVYDLSNSLGELDQTYLVMQVAYNRRIAAAQFLDTLENRFKSGLPIDTNLLLDAQTRLAEADVQYFEYAVRYALAIKNVHLERGTLLEYNNIVLAGQESSRDAVVDRRNAARPLDDAQEPVGSDAATANPDAGATTPPNLEALQPSASAAPLDRGRLERLDLQSSLQLTAAGTLDALGRPATDAAQIPAHAEPGSNGDFGPLAVPAIMPAGVTPSSPILPSSPISPGASLFPASDERVKLPAEALHEQQWSPTPLPTSSDPALGVGAAPLDPLVAPAAPAPTAAFAPLPPTAEPPAQVVVPSPLQAEAPRDLLRPWPPMRAPVATAALGDVAPGSGPAYVFSDSSLSAVAGAGQVQRLPKVDESRAAAPQVNEPRGASWWWRAKKRLR
ncbi:MAG: TolC family protein [Planctomycetales bacterium]|nr:TolC family protein [Planctomycetales bacterium]